MTDKEREYQKAYREKNKDKLKEYNKNNYANRKDEYKTKNHEYRNNLSDEQKKYYDEYRKNYYQKNKEKIKERVRNYSKNNKEKIKENKKRYRENNKEAIRERAKMYALKEDKEKRNLKQRERYGKNRDKESARKKLRRVVDREHQLAIEKISRKRNRDKINEYHKNPENKLKRNERTRKRRKTDIDFKIRGILSGRLKMAIKGELKYDRSLKLLGCSVEDLKKHLKDKFTEGMSWEKLLDNKIHIDHIVPCSAFDLSLEEAQRFCFNYSNLQPLWGKENIEKNGKVDYDYLIEVDINPNILKEKVRNKLLTMLDKI